MEISSTSPARAALVASACGFACAVVLLATANSLPMVWDEGNAIGRAEGISQWVALVFQADSADDSAAAAPAKPFDRDVIAAHWRYTTQVEGHPAFYGLVIAVGRAVSRAWLPPLAATRFGPILLFSLATAAAAYRLARDHSIAAGVAAAMAIVTMPRLFAHAHYASFDGPLASCWLLTWALFEPARRGGWRVIPLAVALGCTLSCKAPGWFAPLPFLLVSLAARDRAGLKAIALASTGAVAVFYALNPTLWHAPLAGFREFIALNTGRAARPEHNISTWVMGRMYNLDFPLPWYNTLLWTAITVPLGTLALAAVGGWHSVRRCGPLGWTLVACWAALVVVRATPFAPPHDAERLFLPSFAFLGCLAGVGFGAIWRWAGVAQWSERPTGRRTLRGVLCLPLLAAAFSTAWYWPQELSYYNVAVCGLPGATALGMEPTYYWDSLDGRVFDWLYAHTEPNEKILFGAAPPENLALLAQWRTLERGYRSSDPGEYRWYVIQRRASGYRPFDRWLLEHEKPVYQHTIRPAGVGLGPWRLDVPILHIYDYEQYKIARRATRDAPVP